MPRTALVGGSRWAEELNRLQRAQERAVDGIRRIAEEQPTPLMAQTILSRVLLEMLTVTDCQGRLQAIGILSARSRVDHHALMAEGGRQFEGKKVSDREASTHDRSVATR